MDENKCFPEEWENFLKEWEDADDFEDFEEPDEPGELLRVIPAEQFERFLLDYARRDSAFRDALTKEFAEFGGGIDFQRTFAQMKDEEIGDDFVRRLAVSAARELGEYSHAEELCRARLEKIGREELAELPEWLGQLREVYREGGWPLEEAETVLRLAMCGSLAAVEEIRSYFDRPADRQPIRELYFPYLELCREIGAAADEVLFAHREELSERFPKETELVCARMPERQKKKRKTGRKTKTDV